MFNNRNGRSKHQSNRDSCVAARPRVEDPFTRLAAVAALADAAPACDGVLKRDEWLKADIYNDALCFETAPAICMYKHQNTKFIRDIRSQNKTNSGITHCQMTHDSVKARRENEQVRRMLWRCEEQE